MTIFICSTTCFSWSSDHHLTLAFLTSFISPYNIVLEILFSYYFKFLTFKWWVLSLDAVIKGDSCGEISRTMFYLSESFLFDSRIFFFFWQVGGDVIFIYFPIREIVPLLFTTPPKFLFSLLFSISSATLIDFFLPKWIFQLILLSAFWINLGQKKHCNLLMDAVTSTFEELNGRISET